MLPALVTGLGLGALVAAQVGPVSLLCIRTTLRYGFAPGLAVGAGAAAVDTLSGALGMRGAASVVAIGPGRVVLGAAGAAVLVVMGLRTLRAAHRVRLGLEMTTEVVTPARAWRTALAVTASNPLTIASWATAFAAASTASVVRGWVDGVALLAGIVGTIFTRTSVPRRTATSPPSSIFLGSRPVYAGKWYSSSSFWTYGMSTTFSLKVVERTPPASTK